jgi:hypothetical protein
MKKTVVSLIAAVMIILLMTASVFGSANEAADTSENAASAAAASTTSAPVTVTEVPDIRIILEGSLVSFKNVPVSVNGSTLLPLREFLVNLGVPDDGNSFRYDPKEKTVEVSYGQISILLYIGKNEAYINNELVVLNAAPVLHKNFTYIPARAVAEAFGKKVVWDSASRSVLICDAEKYEMVKDILKKSNDASLKTESFRMNMDVESVTKVGLVKENINITIVNEVDKAYKKLHMEFLMKAAGFEFKSAAYYSDNVAYTLDPLSGSWLRTVYKDDEYDKLFEAQSTSPGVREALCAGLSQIKSENEDEITLSGDVYLADYYQNVLSQQAGTAGADSVTLPAFDTFDLTIVLDKNTYLIKRMTMDVSSKEKKDNMTVTTEIGVSVRYEDYNGDFGITVPEDVVKKAVDKETAA